MITFDQAHAIAQEYVDKMAAQIDVDLALSDASIREEPWCWVFSYNSRAYLETGSFRDALAGNGPLVVDKETGAQHVLLTARPFDEQLEELRRQRG